MFQLIVLIKCMISESVRQAADFFDSEFFSRFERTTKKVFQVAG